MPRPGRPSLTLLLLGVLVLAALRSPAVAAAGSWPERVDRRVNDFAGVLQRAERDALDARLRDYEEQTTNQIVVAIFPSLQGESREDRTNKLLRAWGVGQKQKNNGVLLAIYVQDRQMQIEVGYGLESALTDALCGRIVRDILAPSLREGRWAAGIDGAITAMQTVISGKPLPSPARGASRRRKVGAPVGFLLAFIALVLVTNAILAARYGSVVLDRRGWSRVRRGRRGGIHWGGFGGGSGGWGGFGGGGGGWGGGGGFSGGGGSSGGGGAGGSW